MRKWERNKPNLNYREHIFQDESLPLEEMKSCLIVIELNSYFRLRLRLDFLGSRCRFQTEFDKINEVEGY
jgi:hypothetical protein